MCEIITMEKMDDLDTSENQTLHVSQGKIL